MIPSDHGLTHRHALPAVLALPIALSLLAGCDAIGLRTGIGPSPECASHPQPQMCEQAFDAVIAELGGLPQGSRLRIDPVQCAHGRCWTSAYVSPAGGGPDQQLSVDWAPDGRISIGHVVPG